MLPPNQKREERRLRRNTSPYFTSVDPLFTASQKKKKQHFLNLRYAVDTKYGEKKQKLSLWLVITSLVTHAQPRQ
jgi:hypothetical protein